MFSFLRRQKSAHGHLGISLDVNGVHVCDLRANGELQHMTLLSEAATTAEQGATLTRLVKQHNLSGRDCVLVMEPDSYHLLQVEAPDVDASELKSAVRWRIKDLIDYHLDDAVVDVFNIPGKDQPGRAHMMYAVAARAQQIQERVDLIHEAGLRLQAIDISELAIRNLARLLPENNGGVALVYLNGDDSVILIVKDSQLCLARTLEVDTSPWRVGRSDNPPDPQGLVDTLALEVQRSLDYYESAFSQPPVSGVVLAPTDLAVPNLAGMIGSFLSVTARTLDLNVVLNQEEHSEDILQAHCLLSVGGALREEKRSL